MNKHIKSYSPILEAKEVSNDSSAPIDLINKLTLDALNSIFMKKDNSVILLGFHGPRENPLDDIIVEDADSHGQVESNPFELELDCLYIGHPELDEKLKSFGLRRFTINLELTTSASYSMSGDYDYPNTELDNTSTELINIMLNDEDVDLELLSDGFIKWISDYGYDDLIYDLTKNGKILIPN